MKLATYKLGGSERVGVVHGNDSMLFDLGAAAARRGLDGKSFASMLALIDSGERALDTARELFSRSVTEDDLSIPVSDADLSAPLPEPRQMRDGMSFPIHIRQAPRGLRRLIAQIENDPDELARIEAEPLPELPEVYRRQPIYYITNRFSVRGPNSTVQWPRYSKVMDYEMEFGIVTKNRAANIPAAKAREHIFGFTIFNDFSARDVQSGEMKGLLGPAKGKSFDGGNVLGPWIVTADEISDPYNLTMEVRVNGEVRSRSTSAGMLFSFEEIIAYISRDETLMPGEFIGSGTVGNGCGLELGRFLDDGDEVELDVEKIGVLRNRVQQQT